MCVNVAEAYDPHWSMGPTLRSEMEFKTTNCKNAVSPSQFVDLKFYCSKGKKQIRIVSVQYNVFSGISLFTPNPFLKDIFEFHHL